MKKKLTIAVLALFGSTAALWAADAKSNWEDNCAKCHGAEGKGDTRMGRKLDIPDLSDAKVQAAFTDEAAFNAIKSGMKDKDGVTRMKAIDGLADEEIKALVQYVRGLKS
jgi:mono/diheme cytochrome c family protein